MNFQSPRSRLLGRLSDAGLLGEGAVVETDPVQAALAYQSRGDWIFLAAYGLRVGETCALTLDDVDWAQEKIRVRRPKSKRIQEFLPTREVGNEAAEHRA